jgi:hypothetical protein
MSDEDVAPSRAEIDSFLWALKRLGTSQDSIREAIIDYLHDRGVSDKGVDLTLSDLHTYSNYPVERVADAEG